MIGLSALDFTFCSQLGCVPILTEDTVGWVVNVVSGIGHIVDRADGNGELRIRVWHFCQIDRASGIWSRDARATEEKTKNVVVLAVDPSQVFIRAKHVVESNGVPCRDKVKLNGANIIHTRDIEILSNQRRHTVGNGEQIRISGYFKVVLDKCIHAAIIHICRVIGHLSGQDEPRLNGKFCRVEAGNVANLNRATCVDNIGGHDARPKQDVIHVFIRR